jgi:hypothetical protein
MGAIKPWHILTLGCCAVFVVAVVLTIVLAVRAANKDR